MKETYLVFLMIFVSVFPACERRTESTGQLLVFGWDSIEIPQEGAMHFTAPAATVSSKSIMNDFQRLCASTNGVEPFAIPSRPWAVVVYKPAGSVSANAVLLHSEGTVGWVYENVQLDGEQLTIRGVSSGAVDVTVFSENLFDAIKDRVPEEVVRPYASRLDNFLAE